MGEKLKLSLKEKNGKREEGKEGREIEGERQVDQLCSLGWSGIPNQLLTVNRWGGWGLQDPPYSLVGSL